MTKQQLKIAENLAFPLNFVTGTQAILATKGKGKTYLAQVEAEELLDAGQVVIAIDPTDAWWGLRSSADGKSAGYPIAVFGGDHGDVKLEETAGAELAQAIVTERFSAVICTEGLGAGAEVRFVREFLETIYRKNREPLHIFVDEADMFAPQKPYDPEDAKSIRTMSNIVRRGRKKGIGCTMITQRSAVLNKDVLSMVDMLMVLGMSHNLDIEPVEKWMMPRRKGLTEEQYNERVGVIDKMLATLPDLQIGDAWAWAPAKGLHKKFRAREKYTFDSGATPKAGQKVREAKVLAPIDIQRLGEKIAATVARAKESDPKSLRARIGELERKLAAAKPATTKTEIREVPILRDAQISRLETALKAFTARAVATDKAIQHLRIVVDNLSTGLAKASVRHPPPTPVAPVAPVPRIALPPRASNGVTTRTAPDGTVTRAHQRILDALAVLERIGIPTPSKIQTALVAGASPTSGSYGNNLGALRTAGLISYPSAGRLSLTDAGRERADGTDAPASTSELHAFVRELVGPTRWRIVNALVTTYPKAMTKEVLADAAGASVTSGSYGNNLGSLRTLGLIDYPQPGMVVATDVLFLGDAS